MTSAVRPTFWTLLALMGGAACSSGGSIDDIRSYTGALDEMETHPDIGFDRCALIRDKDLRDDCRLVALEKIARNADEPTPSLRRRCRDLRVAVHRDECAFQLAEARSDVDICGDAGGFEADCRLHLLSVRMGEWAPPNASMGDPDLRSRFAAEVARFGLPSDDMRAWSAWYRQVLSQRSPLDIRSCTDLPTPDHVRTCRETGKAVFMDRLNHARDTGAFPCGGGVGGLPLVFRFEPDPDLQAILDEWTEEICP